MRDRRTHVYSIDRPDEVGQSHNLPADIMHAREAEWLNELKVRLAAVEAWRGQAGMRGGATRRDGVSN